MKLVKRTLLSMGLLLASLAANAQDTFSIVALDSTTGEVGSAGASCLGFIMPDLPHGAVVISDVIPGKGAIHTQAQLSNTNQKTAHDQMIAGKSPKEIIAWMMKHDADNDSSIRQYGIVDYNGGHPRAAGFTGKWCYNYKNHITGPNYSIQGNILLGQQILDSMEARFLRQRGTLADKLMAALQGAKTPGADTRCSVHGTSSLSSFIRVAKPTDDASHLYLDLNMSYDNDVIGTLKTDPIDSLQNMYNHWVGIKAMTKPDRLPVSIYYNEAGQAFLDVSTYSLAPNLDLEVYDVCGRKIYQRKILNSSEPLVQNDRMPAGIYIYKLTSASGESAGGKFMK